MNEFDCIVVGGGVAGAATAYFLATRGAKTLLLDARERANVGATWINGVDVGIFDDIDLGAPPDSIVFSRPPRFVMQAAKGAGRVVIDHPPQTEIDMKALGAWLIERCEAAGVEVRFRARASILPAERESRSVEVRGKAISADVVVDAAGLTSSDWRAHIDEPIDVCSAYQGVWTVRDADAARAYLAAQRVQPGDTLSLVGVEGGYSIINVCVDRDATHAAILTGAMHRPGYRSGARMASEFARGVGWLGRRERGGGGLIPLRAPLPSFVDDRLVRVGDAAGQVFPVHGSGIALGMRAGDMAANAVAAAIQLGDVRATGLWAYNVAWQRRYGALCGVYQPIRYLASSLSPDEVNLLIEAGVMSRTSVRAGMAQDLPKVDVMALTRLVPRLPALAPLAPRLALVGLTSAQLLAHFKRFPGRGPGVEFDNWARKHDSLMARAASIARMGPGDGSFDRVIAEQEDENAEAIH
jgi:flavin-dependent dehydrogenase